MHFVKTLFPEVLEVRYNQKLGIVQKALLLVTLALLSRFQSVKSLRVLLVIFTHLQHEVTHSCLLCRARVCRRDWTRVCCRSSDRHCRLCSLAPCQCSNLDTLGSLERVSNINSARAGLHSDSEYLELLRPLDVTSRQGWQVGKRIMISDHRKIHPF